MALINCPSCGKQVSDQAQRCVHCGHIFDSKPMIKCPECGWVMSGETQTCPKCGFPIHKQNEMADNTNDKNTIEDNTNIDSLEESKRKKRLIFVIVGIVAVLMIVLLALKGGSKARGSDKYGRFYGIKWGSTIEQLQKMYPDANARWSEDSKSNVVLIEYEDFEGQKGLEGSTLLYVDPTFGLYKAYTLIHTSASYADEDLDYLYSHYTELYGRMSDERLGVAEWETAESTIEVVYITEGSIGVNFESKEFSK